MTQNAVLKLTADDAACKTEIDEAILQLASLGVITHVAAFTNYGLVKTFSKRLSTLSTLGIHFNLSSGKALTDPSLIDSLADRTGQFYSPTPDHYSKMDCALTNYLAERVPTFVPLQIKLELGAQFRAFEEEVGREPAFCTLHHDLDQVSVVRNVVRSMFPTKPGRQELVETGRLAGIFSTFLGQDDDLTCARTKIVEMLNRALQVFSTDRCNVAEIVCHPGYESRHLADFTVYIKQRELEFKVWSDPSILKGLQIVSRSLEGFEIANIPTESVN